MFPPSFVFHTLRQHPSKEELHWVKKELLQPWSWGHLWGKAGCSAPTLREGSASCAPAARFLVLGSGNTLCCNLSSVSPAGDGCEASTYRPTQQPQYPAQLRQRGYKNTQKRKTPVAQSRLINSWREDEQHLEMALNKDVDFTHSLRFLQIHWLLNRVDSSTMKRQQQDEERFVNFPISLC